MHPVLKFGVTVFALLATPSLASAAAIRNLGPWDGLLLHHLGPQNGAIPDIIIRCDERPSADNYRVVIDAGECDKIAAIVNVVLQPDTTNPYDFGTFRLSTLTGETRTPAGIVVSSDMSRILEELTSYLAASGLQVPPQIGATSNGLMNSRRLEQRG